MDKLIGLVQNITGTADDSNTICDTKSELNGESGVIIDQCKMDAEKSCCGCH